MYKSFASLCCIDLGAASIPYIQDAILNWPNPYLRSIAIILDNKYYITGKGNLSTVLNKLCSVTSSSLRPGRLEVNEFLSHTVKTEGDVAAALDLLNHCFHKGFGFRVSNHRVVLS